MVRADLAAVRAAAHRHGAPTNDAVLVAVAGALHHVPVTRGEPLGTLLMTVPVSGRRPHDGPPLGNMVSPLLVSVPATGDVPDRLERVAAQVRAHKQAATGPPPIALREARDEMTRSVHTVDQENVSATLTVAVPAARVFAVLADPMTHAAIDGTGWVQEAADQAPLTEVGQMFRMDMYHHGHPDGDYQVANKVQVLDPPRAIGWLPGYRNDDGHLEFGGWIWRYDLAPLGPSQTEVTLTYDWSAVPQSIREYIQFPPFGPEHLTNSLHHLAELAAPTSPGPDARRPGTGRTAVAVHPNEDAGGVGIGQGPIRGWAAEGAPELAQLRSAQIQ